MKTFRRDKLRRLVEAGKVELIGSYHFDDMHGTSGTDKSMPVAIHDPTQSVAQRQTGICYLYPSDFTSGSGACWQNDNGTVTLIVHSNCNYTFRLK